MPRATVGAAAAPLSARPNLTELRAALVAVLNDTPMTPIGIAVSGGPDSFALAVLSAQVAREQGRSVRLLHVHHGLQAAADGWAAGVQALARTLDVACDINRVQVETSQGDGVEAAARHARYQALRAMAEAAGIQRVMLAHHLDDQAETVLLRLLRGAGPEGMGAMAASTVRDGITYLRPWLGVQRTEILAAARQFAADSGLTLADDPTNLDPRYARGVLRSQIIPAIAGHWPGYRHTLSRFARLAASNAAVLAEVAQNDLAQLLRPHPAYGDTLELTGWRALSPARRSLLLRAWLAHNGAAMPSEARLAQMCSQLAGAAPDRQVLLRHGDVHVRSYRDRILLERGRPARVAVAQAELEAETQTHALSWRGEAEIEMAPLAGRLCFDPVDEGVDPAWLQARPLRLGLRRGRERLRLQSDGPSRSLKNLYQEAGIPAWERDRLPLLWRGSVLVFAAGLGVDARAPRAAPGIAIRWRADSPGATLKGTA